MEEDKEEAQFARATLQSFFHPNGPRHILIELARHLSFHALWLLVVTGAITPCDVELLLFFMPRMSNVAMRTNERHRNMPLKHRIALLFDCGKYCPRAQLTDHGNYPRWVSEDIIRSSKWGGLIPTRVFVSLLEPQDTVVQNLAWRPPGAEEKKYANRRGFVFPTSDWTVIRDTIAFLSARECIRLSIELQRCGRNEVARLVRSTLRMKVIEPFLLFYLFADICIKGCVKTFAELWRLVSNKYTFFSKGVMLGLTPQQCVAPPLKVNTKYCTLMKNDLLCIACRNGNPDGGVELVEYLLDNVCPPGRFYECQLYPLRAACSTGNETLVRYLLGRFLSDEDNIAKWGDTARRCLECYWQHLGCQARLREGGRPETWCDYSESWDGMKYPLDSITGADPPPDAVDAAIAEMIAAS